MPIYRAVAIDIDNNWRTPVEIATPNWQQAWQFAVDHFVAQDIEIAQLHVHQTYGYTGARED